ncbi:BMP family ABC transporter substrate-binding protein [Variovorax sp. LT1R16]|uniref:BMP family ABC transporter substrate-binding protein n=1 Tax=Variovorax sp. LT1R16 TaxID=3443728 RepID=UPI003F47CBAE
MTTHATSRAAAPRRQILKAAAGLGGVAMASALYPLIAHAKGGLIALVHTQAAGDASAVDAMIARLKLLGKETGMQTRAIYAKDPSTYETIFRTLGDAGAAVIVSTFNEVTEPFKALAPKYPKTQWLQLFGDEMKPAIANVTTVSYDYYLGTYLAGIFAGRMTTSGKIGFIGGMSIPPLNADFNAFKAGVLSVHKNATVTVAFAGSFQDPVKGREIATQMYNSGIDFIQTDAAATDAGIIAAANDKPGRLVSCLDPAQYPQGPKSLVSIVSLHFGKSLYDEASRIMKAGKGGSHLHTGLGTGVVALELSPLFQKEGDKAVAAKAEATMAEIRTAQAAILGGTLKVPFNTVL